MRKLIFFTTLLISGVVAMGQQMVSIKGKVCNFEPGDMVSVTQRGDFAVRTLAEAPINDDGSYVLNVPVEKAGKGLLNCLDNNVEIWLEDEDLIVNFEGRDTATTRMIEPKMVEIKGGAKNRVMNWLNFVNIRSYKDMVSIYNKVKGSDIPEPRLDLIREELMIVSRERLRDYTRMLVLDNQTTTSVIALFSNLSADKDSALIEQTLDAVIAANPTSNVAQNYRSDRAERLALEAVVAVGKQAPNLVLEDRSGKKVNLDSYKGKVLVVDFWASWCGPCRAEIPKLKKIYDDYKDNKNVEFVSISIDGDNAAWLKALDKEAMPWPQLHAPGEGRDARKIYRFVGIPHIICIAADGTIFRKNIRGEGVRTAIVDALAK